MCFDNFFILKNIKEVLKNKPINIHSNTYTNTHTKKHLSLDPNVVLVFIDHKQK